MTTSPQAPARPLHEDPAIYARRWFLLGVMCLSLVMVVMGVSGLNVAIPSIQRDLEATATDLQWIFDSYAIVFAGLLLTAGALGDRFGRKKALMFGLAVFGIGAVIGTFANTSTAVIVSRSVMGMGAAFVMPSTLSLLTSIFPPHERRKAIALWAGFAGAGGALGPLIVGFLLTDWWIFPSHWWGSTFLVNTIAAAVVLVVVAILAPESKDEEVTPLDPIGAVLSLVGLGTLLYAIIEGPTKGWSSTEVVGGFVIAAVALGAFIWWEFHTEHPMLPMRFFRERGFSTGSGVITFAFFVMFGFFFLIGQYVQFVRGYSPLEAGLALMPFAFMLILVAPRSAKLGERFGSERDRRHRLHRHDHRLHPVLAPGTGLVVLGDPGRLDRARRVDGHHGCAGDGSDHGLGTAQPGRCRVRGQRHVTRARRRARDRRARLDRDVGVSQRHRRVRASTRGGRRGW